MAEPTPSDPTAILLQQYKAYLADLGNIGLRHENSRRFYLSVVSALLVFLSMAGEHGPLVHLQRPVQIVVGVTGVTICLLWFLHMLAFGALFRAKFDILRKMEKGLAFQIFLEEWAILKDDLRFSMLTVIDSVMPFVFAAISVAILVLK
jgi:hypothetical protein